MKPIHASGSNRQYYREIDEHGQIVIRTVGTSLLENRAFLYLTRVFQQANLPVPQIYSISSDGLSYTQEDLGSTSLFDYIKPGREEGRWTEEILQMLEKTIRLLPHFQLEGASHIDDWSICYPVEAMDTRSIMWDLNYFKYCYLKPTGIEIDEPALEDEFEAMTEYLLGENFKTFMYRDFQSRNVMIKDGEPYFIDYQGGRRGPIYYDLASFLWQAKAHFTPDIRKHLIEAYINELEEHMLHISFSPQERIEFQDRLIHFVLFRLLQVLGAYGFRGKVEGKPHFLESLPIAEDNTYQLFVDYPYLQQEYPYIYVLFEDNHANRNRH